MVEINKGMSELLDIQVDTQNLKTKVLGFTQALVKWAMKLRVEEKIAM